LLGRALEAAGIATIRTREPGGSPGAEAIRRLLLEGDSERWDALCEVLLLYAARRDHVRRLIAPALARGDWVLCDRFADSTIAYQGYGRGLLFDDLQAVHQVSLGDFSPDLTLVLDLPSADGLRRAMRRSGRADRFEGLDQAFHERLRQGFRSIAAGAPERCVLIDARSDIDTVHRAIVGAVALKYGIDIGPR
jgi:dTMP kinase